MPRCFINSATAAYQVKLNFEYFHPETSSALSAMLLPMTRINIFIKENIIDEPQYTD
jgi:hypothetical protein